MPIAIHQVLASLGYGDAIGHEVLGIQRVLRAAGYESEIFAETADPQVDEHIVDYWSLTDASHPDNILIHHFSIGSRASRLAYALPDRMVLVYHNVTPPEYFIGIHPALVELCYLGRRELGLYAHRCDLALGDSEFNRQELQTRGFPRTGVLPVVPDFAHLDVPANFLQAHAFEGWVNVLFVGRMIPNKRIEDVIAAFAAYKRRFNRRSRLLLIGSSGGFERYVGMLGQMIERFGVKDVYFLGHVPDDELVAYYQLADVFLCQSEHEGFCVPLLEAFHFGVPVLAYGAAAVPETMDGAGIVFTEKDPMYVAALIDRVVEDDDVRARLVDGQDAALERYRARDFAGTLLRYLDQVLRSPRGPRHEVAPGFWDQVRLHRRLDDIRLVRPAAFQALPDEPGTTRSKARDRALTR